MNPNPHARSQRRGWLLLVALQAAMTVWAVTRGEMTIAAVSGIALVAGLLACDMQIGDGAWSNPEAPDA